MPDLGKKWTCFSCGAKFYDLRKAQAVCPKCKSNQKDAPPLEASATAPKPVRRSRDEFADPDAVDRDRDEEMEGGGPIEERPFDDEELPLGEAPIETPPIEDDESEY